VLHCLPRLFNPAVTDAEAAPCTTGATSSDAVAEGFCSKRGAYAWRRDRYGRWVSRLHGAALGVYHVESPHRTNIAVQVRRLAVTRHLHQHLRKLDVRLISSASNRGTNHYGESGQPHILAVRR